MQRGVTEMATKEKTTFSKICEAQPEMNKLLLDVQAVKDDCSKPTFCANRTWYNDPVFPPPACNTPNSFNGRLGRLVGWDAEIKDKSKLWLKTSDVYDIAFNALYQELPDCRNCLCL
jgi:hypothetical protein